MIIHAIIFCWPGQERNTFDLVQQLLPLVECLTVIDASLQILPRGQQCEWVKVNTNYYYGMKFYTALSVFKGDILLQIQADAASNDWAQLVSRCREAFLNKAMGVWAPDVDYTFWTTPLVRLMPTTKPGVIQVTQTDCIVWAMSRCIVERMQQFDYHHNHLGWGIDTAAIAYAYANKYWVVRDITLRVLHPRGSGYDRQEAVAQMNRFLSQLDYSEKIQLLLLQNHINFNLGNSKK